MFRYSESADCPRCGSEDSLERSIDREGDSGICLECGYEHHTVFSVLTIEVVNKERVMMGINPLKKLKPHLKGWQD